MSNFSIWINGAWVVPPDDAMPVGIGGPIIDGAPIVRRYPPRARDGRGNPVAQDDELFAVVGRPYINSTGLQWWYATVGMGIVVSKDINVRLWDPVSRAWLGYRGRIWPPSYNSGMAGLRITNFLVRFTNLVRL